jgi:WhiB family transcriptional regulator, redox-sensing transcriptional regulator
MSTPVRTNEQPWVEGALCAQTDPEVFFPKDGGPIGRARRVCAACPVVADCLEYALANEEAFGVWGGTSPLERRRMRRARRAA